MMISNSRTVRLWIAALLISGYGSYGSNIRANSGRSKQSSEAVMTHEAEEAVTTDLSQAGRELQSLWYRMAQESSSMDSTAPTSSPSSSPSSAPTTSPSASPSSSPSASPSSSPTNAPSESPSSSPTPVPTTSPSSSPTAAPIIGTPAPVLATPAPVLATPAPVIGTPAPVVATPAPVVATPAPVVATPAPVVATPAPVVATPAPVVATPAPVVATPAPVVATPAPVVATPAPVVATPAPVTSPPTPAPVPDPTAAPVTPAPTVAPVTPAPTPAPVTPSPTPAPVTPAPTPAPTPSPTRSRTFDRLLPFALQGGAEFENPNSYQTKAVRRIDEQIGSQSFTTTKLVQYYSLYCIFTATNGVGNAITDTDPRFDGITLPGWLISTGWKENNVDPCSGWFGIDCQNGQVTVISLFENVLLGSFPPEVSLLASNGPRSTGAGSLIGIDLFNNEFLFNNFDNSWMSFLGTRLEYLFFQATSFAGNLPRLPTGLIEFDCSFTLISGGLVEGNFAGLNRLNFALLDGNAYNSTVPADFGTLGDLEFLYISDAFVSGDLSYMIGMPSMVEHWIDVNPGLGGQIPFQIGAIPTLASFSVTLANLVGTIPEEFGNLSNMVQLWLYGNDLSGTIPASLGDLPSMALLQLEGNSFSGSMPVNICKNVGFLRPLLTLGADCADPNFLCECCTCCDLQACNPELF